MAHYPPISFEDADAADTLLERVNELKKYILREKTKSAAEFLRNDYQSVSQYNTRQIYGQETYSRPGRNFERSSPSPPVDRRQICGPETFSRFTQINSRRTFAGRSPSPDARQVCGPETYVKRFQKNGFDDRRSPSPVNNGRRIGAPESFHPETKEIANQGGRQSPSLSARQICGPETYAKPGSRPNSPPTKEIDRPDSSNDEIDPKQIAETLELLKQVTYIRVIIDSLLWDKAPKFVHEEAKHQKSPRAKGQIFAQYRIAGVTSTTPRGSGKVVKAVAKEITPKVVQFGHRHVALCDIIKDSTEDKEQRTIEFWAQANLEIKFFYRPPTKKTVSCFAKCVIPLRRILVMPFWIDAIMPLDMAVELSNCKGSLKVSVQLGSRSQYFFERVEPMRNPTTAFVPIPFSDPNVFNAVVEEIPANLSQATNQNRHYHVAVEKHGDRNKDVHGIRGQNREISNIPLVVEDIGNSSPNSGRFGAGGGSSKGFYPIRPTQETNLHNGMFANERGDRTFLMPESQPAPEPLNLNFIATSSPLPEIDRISSVWDRPPPLARPQTQSNNSDIAVQTVGKSTKDKQTEIERRRFSPEKSDYGTQTTAVAHSNNAGRLKSDSLDASRSDRSRNKKSSLTVAERLKNHLNVNIEFPAIQSSNNVGFWLQLVINRAKHLPMIKNRQTNRLHKPDCYVSYRNNENRIFTSDVVKSSIQPIWNWTSQLYVPKDRKNVLFKLWYRPLENDQRDKVLGFVSVDLPNKASLESTSSWFDIVDLGRNSTGQLQITFGPLSSVEPPSNVSGEVHDEDAVLWKDFDQSSSSSSNLVNEESESEKNKNNVAVPPVDKNDVLSNWFEKGVNTSMNFPPPEQLATKSGGSTRSSLDPFVDLTTRSFLANKLKHNIDELDDLLVTIKRHANFYDDSSAAAVRRNDRPESASHVNVSPLTVAPNFSSSDDGEEANSSSRTVVLNNRRNHADFE